MADNLKVELIYLYPKENSQQHKTHLYELVHDENLPVPVLRRGFKFTMAIRFEGRNYVPVEDNVKLILSYGPDPNPIKGTKAYVTVNRDQKNSEEKKLWRAGLLSNNGDTLTLEIYIPPDCPVGLWNLQVQTSNNNSISDPSIFDYENDLYILFNPWSCDDLVYLPDERLLDEYILSDVGKIWVGPWGTSRGREWVYGQFDARVLLAAMLMFEKSGLSPSSRGDPILTTRCISRMVNSNDDDGVLVGRWDGEYEDGTAPAAWTGSIEILEQYLETQTSVSYGQCWVFSGVVTSICRALGIPSRVVSNLVSAHDANSTLSVDKYYDENNEELDYDPMNKNGEDSIWNYHVWNDVWMARPDLPTGYGGWQAIDATPQETSSGFFQCGPASLEAIKKGAVGFNYDVGFMLASVNADLMRWKLDSKSELGFSRIYCNKYHIGKVLLTKQPWTFDPNGDKDRQDITDQYKSKEGSEEERLSLYKAVRSTELAKSFYSMPDSLPSDVEFDLAEIDRVKIGQPFKLFVNIKNNSDQIRSIKAALSTASVFYTGIKAKTVKKVERKFTMKPKSAEQLHMTVEPDDYLDKLVEYCNMKLYAIASVDETKQTWAEEDDFQVLKPKIDIKIPEEIPIGKPASITLRFVNPLNKMLTKCRFNISGPTLLRNQVLQYKDVQPNGLVKVNTTIVPKTVGDQKIVATFTSKGLVDITGSAKTEVYDDDE